MSTTKPCKYSPGPWQAGPFGGAWSVWREQNGKIVMLEQTRENARVLELAPTMFELLDTILTEFEDRYDGAPDAHMQWMGTLMHEIESLKAKL